jgi:UDP-N-acetylglucosamine/UDP-N-acetylgalactosamine diphosphorylase
LIAGVLPCLTNEGKIFLESKGSVATAPDGNGGIYAALRSRTATKQSFSVREDMHRRKIEYIYCYCVDNCLAKVGDPVFLGYCIQKGAKCGTKVVKKTDPKESVGVVALRGGKWSVVEYSEISTEHAAARNQETGDLLFKAANIANHFYTLAYLDSTEALEQNMAFHIARKKIPHVDLSTGESIKPSKPNGMKLEQFIFDVLPFLTPLNTHALFQVDRSSEFSPLKNAPGTGSDDPQTSRRDLLNLQKKWLQDAGATVKGEVELSPLVSYAGEGLEQFKGKTIREGRVETVEELEALCE